MDKRIIKGLVDEKLEVIQEQFTVIKSREGKIPAIELDLLMSSIRDLYELVLSLQVENISIAITKPASEPEPAKTAPAPSRFSSGIISIEPVISEPQEEIVKPVAEPIPEPEPEPDPAPEPDPEPEPLPEPESQPVMEPHPEPTMTLPPEPTPQQRIAFDLFSSNAGNTLADRLREGQDKRLADKFNENKITDLKTTIGINDKFLFINELFNGDMRTYDEAVQKLNSCFTIAQADLLLLDLKINLNWDSDSPSVKKFVELVRRKF